MTAMPVASMTVYLITGALSAASTRPAVSMTEQSQSDNNGTRQPHQCDDSVALISQRSPSPPTFQLKGE